MINQNSKVSIVVPFYNAADFIELTVESVLLQTHANWELLLVNDGSTDNSACIIKKYLDDERIFLLEHPDCVNLGVSKSRALGIKKAKGEFIAFLDADDLFYPNKLEEQLLIFSRIKDIILVHSKVELLKNNDIPFKNEFILDDHDRVYDLHNRESWLNSNEICNSTVIVKSKVLKDVEFGLPQLFQFEDWLLWSLIAEKGKFYYQNKAQVKYRIHPASATAEILKKSLLSPYSKIEFLISFYLLSNSDKFSEEIIKHLKETILKLFEIYSEKNLDKTDLFNLDFSQADINAKMVLKQYDKLSEKIARLNEEVVEVKKIKNSMSYFRKIISFLKSIKIYRSS